mmetsp:Transcript_12610/g.37364  ORF Transcript_12610/g.37364 Transcript_12610/m.37364 type:complete len:276 (-) Transcript_12610:6-833(-)
MGGMGVGTRGVGVDGELPLCKAPSQRAVRQLVARNELSLHAALVDDGHPDDSARGAVARHGVAQALRHEVLALLLCHARLEEGVAKAVDVRRAGAARRVLSLHQRAPDRQRKDLPALLLVPAGHDDARREHVFVLVAEHLEEVGCCGDLWRLPVLHPVLVQEVAHVVAHRLRVGGGAGAAAVDTVVDSGDLVGRAVGDVHAGGDSGVGSDDHAAVILDGHDGGPRVNLLAEEVEPVVLLQRRPSVVRRLHDIGRVEQLSPSERAHGSSSRRRLSN